MVRVRATLVRLPLTPPVDLIDPLAMPDLPRAMPAFLAEHERRVGLDTGLEDLRGGGYRVWVTCGCGARIERRYSAPEDKSA